MGRFVKLLGVAVLAGVCAVATAAEETEQKLREEIVRLERENARLQAELASVRIAAEASAELARTITKQAQERRELLAAIAQKENEISKLRVETEAQLKLARQLQEGLAQAQAATQQAAREKLAAENDAARTKDALETLREKADASQEELARHRAMLRTLIDHDVPVMEILGQEKRPAETVPEALEQEIARQVEQLKSDDAARQKAAAEKLVQIGRPALLPLLRLAENDAEKAVRRRAALAITELLQGLSQVIEGQVWHVRDDGLVMLSVGADQGVRAGMFFTILREDQRVGQVKVAHLYRDMCVAEIIQPESSTAQIQKHDRCLARLPLR